MMLSPPGHESGIVQVAMLLPYFCKKPAMRKRLNLLPVRLLLANLLSVIFGFVAPADGQSPQVLKGTGLHKLDAFLGTWRAEATDSASKGKISAVNTIRWSPGGGFLIADQSVTIGDTHTNNLSIYSYNPGSDDYTLTIVGIPGRGPFSIPIAYSGDTLVYHSAYTDGGQRYYNRTLNIFKTPGEYVYLIQSSTDSVRWQTSGEGRSVKEKP